MFHRNLRRGGRILRVDGTRTPVPRPRPSSTGRCRRARTGIPMTRSIGIGPRRLLVAAFAALCLAAGALLALAAPDQAEAQQGPVPTGQLTEVTNFGANPGNLQMYVYVPDNVDPNPALLVGVHWCTGSGPDFYNGTEYARLAEQYGYIVVYPSVTRSSKCFDVSSPQAL